MIFSETELKGAFIVDPERHADHRGFFARTFCEEEFRRHGLISRFVQCNVSFNSKKGTLRGMHFQIAPKEEGKLVRCTSGAIYDAIVDLRPDSPTFLNWVGAELTKENRRALYIPPGFAHGFQTLSNDAEVFYQMTEFFEPRLARGVRWNDPAFGIQWPLQDPILSEKDSLYPDFQPEENQ